MPQMYRYKWDYGGHGRWTAGEVAMRDLADTCDGGALEQVSSRVDNVVRVIGALTDLLVEKGVMTPADVEAMFEGYLNVDS